MSEQKTGSELFVVDNSDTDWKVLQYLREWCQITKELDIASGYFEIGSLLALDGEWQKIDKIRILMGNEVTARTMQAFRAATDNILKRVDESIEKEKEQNDFLTGVLAVVEALRSGKIQCRVYRKRKFHAKAYITHARLAVVGAVALVGSSNFTLPGLTENIELNVQITGRQVSVLQEWFEGYWQEAEDVTPDILGVFERHIREYTPFEIYAKALQEFFRGHEMTADEWELVQSHMYPVLDQYQKEGYHALLKIASRFGGAFLCDGVGLGKTYIGLMLIERLVVHDRKRVALFVPKSARQDVWERDLRRYLQNLAGDFSNLVVFNHTDLLRGPDFQRRFQRIQEMADVIVIDEAHHFRNPGPKGQTRYWRLYDLLSSVQGVKQVYLLTATPVNNRLHDFQHMIELFSRHQADFFKDAPLGIHSLGGHFNRLEQALDVMLEVKGTEGTAVDVNQVEAEKVLWNDALFRALVVQRSREYVKKSQLQHGSSQALFPERKPPRVAFYDLQRTYGNLLASVKRAFQRGHPLFSLAVYYPMAYYKGPDIDKQKRSFQESRQREVVGLIRTLFLKRFESSAKAFESSCGFLLLKLLAWVTKHSKSEVEKRLLERWKRQHDSVLEYVKVEYRDILIDNRAEEVEEDIIDAEMLEEVEELSPEEFKIDEILNETYLDLDQVSDFLKELMRFKPEHDDKLKALLELLHSDPDLQGQKVLIFSEFMATTSYLRKQLELNNFENVASVDSMTKDRSQVIRRFAPYYNCLLPGESLASNEQEIRILVSTDVLSEGLNLQDASRLINYDLHWNPVRLMQRIGRVDRRLDPAIEQQILADHPEQKEVRGKVMYWNFLPPNALEDLLQLYSKVSHKTLRISKVFGIEGKKLLHPDDDYPALLDFDHSYEGETTANEAMHLEFQQLLKDNPGLEERLKRMPLRVFSGKRHPEPGTQAIFFCYALPAPTAESKETKNTEDVQWTEEAGFTKWYLIDLATEKILEGPSEIIGYIRSATDTPRVRSLEEKTLVEYRAKMDKHVKNTYLKQVQAPVGVKQILKAWLELS